MKYKLNSRDWIKGLLMATLVPVLYIIQSSIDAGQMTFNWKEIGMAAVGGLVGYILKNFFTDDVKVAQKIMDEQSKIKASAPNDQELNKP